ncbi:hypothetical protein ACIBL8_43085 [Streptomyces sp. NPDC050523]|uniref:hypothetical protein n=1 Tax=Streptomyces sp. NPDC050523 TaxID=3365622 RepID=UPI0037B50AEF
MIARDLRVSERSVESWRRGWRQSGMDALASSGQGDTAQLSDGQFTELAKELTLGPAEHGREDQRWTVARIRAVIAVRFESTARRRRCAGCCTGTAGPGSLPPAEL